MLPVFETVQLILSENLEIIQYSDDFPRLSSFKKEHLLNKPLRETLLAIHPEWDTVLTEGVELGKQELFLPWFIEKKASITGIKIHFIKHEKLVFATLSPSLAPYRDLQSSSFSELKTQSPETAQLFLRLQSSESKLKNYIENFPGIFFSQRSDFSFNSIGPGFKKLLGIPSKKLLRSGSLFLRLFLEQDKKDFIQQIKKNYTESKPLSLTYRLKNPTTGSIIYLLDARVPILSPSGLLLGYEGVWLDVTRQSIAEDKLTRSAWKESLAVITNGLIHDFSNIMAGIYSLSEIYASSINKNHKWYEGVHQIQKNAKDAQRLIRRIMDLNRDVTEEKSLHDARQLINGQMDLIKIILPKKASIEIKTDKHDLPIYVEDVSFRQMLLNFCTNASDALDGDPKVEIQCLHAKAHVPLFKDATLGEFIPESDGVQIHFHDNGKGIDPTIIDKIFDPFFTTKDSLKGSGFGLYNIKLFIKENGGYIDLKSDLNKGTTFYIYLPLARLDEDEGEPEKQQQAPRIVAYGSEDISNFKIIEFMRAKEWEVVCFDTIKKVNKHLQESLLTPDAFFIMDIGIDDEILNLTQRLQKHFPSSKRILQTIGRNPDEIETTIAEKMDLTFFDNSPHTDIINKTLSIL